MDTINKQLKVRQVFYPTSQAAWEGINEIFIKGDPILFTEGEGGRISSSAIYAYNVVVNIRKAWMDPEFDFGKLFNYQKTKWNLLLNNYVNFNQLDLMRSQVRSTELKRNHYNYSFDFDNTHSNGKGCLIAASFCRRDDLDIPIIIANLRSSEITKRLAFDLLLLQRLGEYVYGGDQTFMIQLNCNQMYAALETLIMYDTHKSIKKVTKGLDSVWIQKVLKMLKFFKTCDEKDVKYKVYRRTLACIQPGKVPGKKEITLCAKDLLLGYDDIPYPESCISYTARQAFKKKYLKQKEDKK